MEGNIDRFSRLHKGQDGDGFTNNLDISVVVPVYNEEEVVSSLYEKTAMALEQLNMSYEIIFIDDGSNDDSLRLMKKLNSKDPRVKIVSFSRNFGHQIAVTAGLRYVSGDCVVVMDGDLQDPPEVISEMVTKWREGFEVVYGVRRHRKEGWIKRICYSAFYAFLNKIAYLYIPSEVGDFCLMDRRVAVEMRRFLEERPFVRGLRSWVGFKQIGIEYERAAREEGHSKYSMSRLWGLAFDGIFSFSTVALRITLVCGIAISFGSIVYAAGIALNRIFIFFGFIDSARFIPGWATLVCSIMFLLGLQFFFLGILGEYIGRIFMQVKGRPLFVVSEEVGFGAE